MFGLGKSSKVKTIDKDLREDVLYAPLCGEKRALEKVNDPVFANKIMGDGIAILPKKGELYSPVNGKVSVVFSTKHVIGIESNYGLKVIIHIGIDTVNNKGKGFNVKVKQGDIVKVGELLMRFNLSSLSKDYDMIAMITIENSKEFELDMGNDGKVEVGSELIKVKRVK